MVKLIPFHICFSGGMGLESKQKPSWYYVLETGYKKVINLEFDSHRRSWDPTNFCDSTFSKIVNGL